MSSVPHHDMIAADGLYKSFGTSVVLEDVSLALPSGQCLALLGPNGSGKTTLLRILAALVRPSSGRLSLDGIDALREPERARGSIGMVGHGSFVYEDLTAFENLRFWATMGGQDASADRLRWALQQVDLEAVAEERARTFSAGMKRRLTLARTLLGRARLLLLDEPLTGLDRRGQKWLSEFLLAFKASGGAVVMATHSFSSSLMICDRVGILAGGRLVLDRPRGELSYEDVRELYDSLTVNHGTGAE